MYNPDELPRCPGCGVIRTPGAPMCTSCWMSFDDEPLASATSVVEATLPTAEPQPVVAMSGASMVLPPWESAPTPVADGPAPVAPANAAFGWRPPATDVSPTPLADPRRPGRVLALGAVALLVLLLGGGYLVFRSTGDSEKQLIAERFTSGRPPALMPAVPDFTAGLFEKPAVAGDIPAFMATADPQVRAANTAMVALQRTFDRWAHGKASDQAVRADITAFLATLKPFSLAATDAVPASLGRGFSKLSRAAYDYEMALNSLQDWMDAGSRSAKTTFSLLVGSANELWDEGIITLYKPTQLEQPKLPHPPVKH